ncbi:hypothetical protein ASD89_05280 [Caulobacter sp. Root656]|nr:hypothetical protein ASD89_05280 [Caulobacter sp. Root656]
MRSPSYNRARAHAVRIKWIVLAFPVASAILLAIDMSNGWVLDRSMRLALIAALALGLVVHFAMRLVLVKWFSGSFTDDQDPMRF